jgi:hypothetical protein
MAWNSRTVFTTKKRRARRESGENLRALRFFVVDSASTVGQLAETMIKAGNFNTKVQRNKGSKSDLHRAL